MVGGALNDATICQQDGHGRRARGRQPMIRDGLPPVAGRDGIANHDGLDRDKPACGGNHRPLGEAVADAFLCGLPVPDAEAGRPADRELDPQVPGPVEGGQAVLVEREGLPRPCRVYRE